LHCKFRFSAFTFRLLEHYTFFLFLLLLWHGAVRYHLTQFRRGLLLLLWRLLLLRLRLLRLVNNTKVPEHEVADKDLLIERAAGIRELDVR
jgi:hypothetical protein